MKRRWVRAAAAGLLAAAAAVWLASGIYSVEPTEQAVVLRFGRAARVVGSGLHYRLPWPVERELVTAVHQQFTTSAGFRILDAQRGLDPLPFETEWLTGDRNLVNIQMYITYFIKDQRDYLFACRDNRAYLIRWAAEVALTDILGGMRIDDVFAERNRVALTVRRRAQELLDTYRAGVELTAVSPREIDAPAPVWSAFNRANQAKAEIDKRIREARQKEYQLLERARADSRTTIDRALAEREAQVSEARGRGQAFLALEEQYRVAPEGTRNRLVQETLRDVLSKVRVIQAATDASLEIFVEP